MSLSIFSRRAAFLSFPHRFPVIMRLYSGFFPLSLIADIVEH